MKRTLKTMIAFTGIVFLSSCVKVLDYDIPEDEKRIVVNGILSNLDTFSVNINKSLHILDRLGTKPVNDALVQLYRDEVPVVEMNEGINGLYSSAFVPDINHTYLLKVSVPGMRTATAQCVLPSSVPIEKADTTLIIHEDPYNVNMFYTPGIKTTIVFNDPAETENYYELEGVISYLNARYYTDEDTFYITGYNRSSMYSNASSNDPVIEYSVHSGHIFQSNNESETMSGDKLLFADRLINGMKYSLNVDFYSYLFDLSHKSVDSVRLDIRLKSVNKDYYTYMQLLEGHMQAKNDPFSEPAQAYTNIENGLGILAGMSESVYSIELNKTQKTE
ncbi:MAG: DUF4249 domain-containing protein [Bacteroidales bacterium]|nr:DUF4249 domain-containing protein [Bacteroidales bacterium]